MKKLICILSIMLLIVGCGSKSDSHLYKMSVCQKTNDIDNNVPNDIYLFNEVDYSFADAVDGEQIAKLVELFKNIEVADKVDAVETPTLSINITYDDDIDSMIFYGDVVELYDKDGNVNYYKLTNHEAFVEYANEIIAENVAPIQGTVVLDSNDIIITQNDLQFVDDNIILTINAVNNSARDAVLMIDACVDGYDIFGYQQLGVFAENEIGYDYTIPVSLLKEYGVNEFGTLEYVIKVFEMEEDHDAGDFICKSDTVTCELGTPSSASVNENVAYSEGGISLSCKFVEAETNTNAYLYIKNGNAADAEFDIEEVIVNGASSDYGDFFDMHIKANDDLFALLPIYNYNYDSETYEVTKYDIETLCLVVDINDVETTIVIK